MTPAAIIAARLVELGWSQSDLARAAGMHRQRLGDVLSGKRPMLARHLFVIDAVLNLGLDLNQFERGEG